MADDNLLILVANSVEDMHGMSSLGPDRGVKLSLCGRPSRVTSHNWYPNMTRSGHVRRGAPVLPFEPIAQTNRRTEGVDRHGRPAASRCFAYARRSGSPLPRQPEDRHTVGSRG